MRNQQIVLRAIIDKITSPSILLNYGNFVDAIGGAFETDMPSSQMKDLIRYQLTVNPHWKFESCCCAARDRPNTVPSWERLPMSPYRMRNRYALPEKRSRRC